MCGASASRRVPRAVMRRFVRRVALLSVGAALAFAGMAPAVSSAHSTTRTHTITYDRYSMTIDGKRTFIWSGEFEYWRLPSPSLWLDILQKMKAEGYNAVTIYFDWAYHSPKPGVYNFS